MNQKDKALISADILENKSYDEPSVFSADILENKSYDEPSVFQPKNFCGSLDGKMAYLLAKFPEFAFWILMEICWTI